MLIISKDAKRVKNLTAREQMFYKQICRLTKQNQQLKSKLKKIESKSKLEAASREKNFIDFLEDMSPLQKEFCKTLRKNAKRKKVLIFCIHIFLIKLFEIICILKLIIKIALISNK